MTLVALGLAGCGAPQPRFALPGVVLWAWERAEDLRFLDPREAGVAFLAGTAVIRSDGSVLFRHRTQALAMPDGVVAIAVVRIESVAFHSAPAMGVLVGELRSVAAETGIRGLQVDFDARQSERGFYRELMDAVPMGITALTSWCSGDRWLEGAPIGEAVPMFFRMGRGERRAWDVESGVCARSIGVSMDEAWPAVRPKTVDRVYVFDPHAWTKEDWVAAKRRIMEWR